MLKEPVLDKNAPWKQRFRKGGLRWTQFAKQAPERGLVSSIHSEVAQLYAWDVPTGKLQALTSNPDGVRWGLLSPEGRYVYFLEDRKGNEQGHFKRVPFEGGQPEDITPGMPCYSWDGLDINLASTRLAFIAALPDAFYLYLIDLGPEGELGSPKLLLKSKAAMLESLLDYYGQMVVIVTRERSKNVCYSSVAIDTQTGERIGELWDGPENKTAVRIVPPLPDDGRFIATTDRSGFMRPLLWNPRTGERRDLDLDILKGEIIPLDWSYDGNQILLLQYQGANQRLYAYNLKSNTVSNINHPSGTFGWAGTKFRPNGEIFAEWEDAAHPVTLIALSSETGSHKRAVLQAEEVPAGLPWKYITFPSSDGETIQGWLGMPDGKGPFPTVLAIHGGPTDVETETFSPDSQAWMDHGFAFLTINYRGSTMFGKEFQEKILVNLGYWELEDMVAARNWLVQNGIAKPGQILLSGGSYGGYLTLWGLARRPDLWAGGLALIPIADWTLTFEDAREGLKAYQAGLFGGTPDEKPEQYVKSSPITYAEDIKAPALIIAGRNDPRCPARQIEVFEQKMRALGKPIELEWFDAGHGSSNVEERIRHQEVMLKFAYRVLSKAIT